MNGKILCIESTRNRETEVEKSGRREIRNARSGLSVALHDQMYKSVFNSRNQKLWLVDTLIIEGKSRGRRDEMILLIMKVIPLLAF